MPVVKLTLQYEGTEFVGWQRQAEGRSVQGALEEALERLEGRRVPVAGAGRTDAGVHALGQVASVEIAREMAPDALSRALNAMLPETVRVVDAQFVAPEFHARFSARHKTYGYRIVTDDVLSPFERRYAWHVRRSLHMEPMALACECLVGRHDFAAFRSTGTDVATTVRTIFEATLEADHDPPRLPSGGVGSTPSPALVFSIRGDGFLRHMVRILVGTLVEVGTGQRTPDSVVSALASGRRADAGVTAPAQGLFLVRVGY